MCNVIRLVGSRPTSPSNLTPDKNVAMVSTLETMLEHARSGRLTGLVYVARVGKKDQGLHVIGDYRQDPASCLAAIESCAPQLGRLLRPSLP